MVRSKHVPTVASARLARELREQRVRAGLSQETVAERMGWAESKLYRIENDKSRLLQRDVRRLVELYGLGDEESHALLALSQSAGEPDWWHSYSGAIPEWFQIYVVLESSACEIQGYESELVPGIMQTDGYARAIMSTAPAPYPESDIDDTVAIRATRQSRLTGDDPVSAWMVLNEAVIRRIVGNRTVMHEQIERLIALGSRPNVTLQVLPFDVGAHSAMHGSFMYLKFTEPTDPDKVYLEHQIGALYTQKPEELDRYRLMFDYLRAQALGPEQTLSLLRQVAAEFASS
ncbi:helix-turn-helix protein [Actinocorallia herbida]|uniref:Helix-turn-helix protein n=1 Tax=Actinocorallia herbida TaxID=58109 RepID=A0A3N1D1F9_9ACTN|nr:helix-turn-helix transcriptional regulator [Actinocorallia herbida]ROO87365.1 helix-turn-helix protein [Actinocorallia herbida]